MTELRWEWTLPTGERVAATLDEGAGIESVLLADRVVSRAPRGSRPQGHAVESKPGAGVVATVKFQTGFAICVLRTPDDEEVAPRVWPDRKRVTRKPPPRPVPIGRLVAIVLVSVAVGVASFFWLRMRRESEGGPLVESYRAPNGLFVVHYGASLSPRPVKLPATLSAFVGVDAKGDAVAIVAEPLAESGRDPWAAHQHLFKEALALLPRDGVGFDEETRREDTCKSARAAVVVGAIGRPDGGKAKTWSCAFVHDDAAYVMVTMAREGATDADRARLLRVVDAAELTKLGPLAPSEGR